MIRTAAPPARRTCVACELLLPPVEEDAPICALCAEDIPAAVRRAHARPEWTMEPATRAWVELNRAVDALDEATAQRWGRMRPALEETLEGRADEATRARVAQARAALDRGAAPALASVLASWEHHWWVRAECAARLEVVRRRLERLDAWIKEKER